jgi:hypothetical protein
MLLYLPFAESLSFSLPNLSGIDRSVVQPELLIADDLRDTTFVPLSERIMATDSKKRPLQVLIVAVPETAGSALYGMVDVLSATGNIWQTLVRQDPEPTLFRVRILAPSKQSFTCGNGIPVAPDCSVADDPMRTFAGAIPNSWS